MGVDDEEKVLSLVEALANMARQLKVLKASRSLVGDCVDKLKQAKEMFQRGYNEVEYCEIKEWYDNNKG